MNEVLYAVMYVLAFVVGWQIGGLIVQLLH